MIKLLSNRMRIGCPRFQGEWRASDRTEVMYTLVSASVPGVNTRVGNDEVEVFGVVVRADGNLL
jgi:hypothetical protein